ncbi:type I polyketide synthase [Ancylobacter defluvii]|uniref:Type I polyketide synthase n=1 Tax=Ancylobacter defluvii TaxID=1282440 RepID=A0A9W6JWK8_9HYPH|nr:type I polyketide synthase [Ancylobacter defluvii]MBS7588636.1 SDR family NAD(P)-dependent oxidoreductase [Ancylobacter defluvii]GLK83916.1 type I polyketide synthase [Ancylobacter defluvii]
MAVLGYACRLPGAQSPEEFWNVLVKGECTVSDKPVGRWDVDRFLHPGPAPGYSYTFAGGYLDDPLGFDAGVFGVSPREAAQIDPQQRLLLEVVWEALESAGMVPSRLSGKGIGVYVGASNVDYQTHTSVDLAAIQSHFIAGNSLSIIANRVSYAFDWSGPSMTIDAACASSFVALHQALRALRDDEIDLAVVAGANLLLSPAPFIGFSAARMLSPTGRCRPFSAQGDGYVRSEGFAAIVLRRLTDARANGEAVRSVIVASGINSDGRTVGISLPSAAGQRQLLDSVYDTLDHSVDRLAFVEAHGTGTPVGDPIEAGAIGASIAKKRSAPLPIGSAKSNFGHLEPVSGLVGLLKASMALQHRWLPKTVFLDELNPNIDFAALNLAPTSEPLALAPGDEPLLAGVCNFGFGGTNAHIVLRGPTLDEAAGATPAKATGTGVPAATATQLLMISAQSPDALSALALRYADAVEREATPLPLLANAAAHRREAMEHRLAIPLGATADVARALREAGDGTAPSLGAKGSVVKSSAVKGSDLRADGKIAFVFSGNGCQWAGMGRRAYALNPAFRAQIDRIDALFAPLAGWSIAARLDDADLAARLKETSTAQPLLFAIQSAMVTALGATGVAPHMVLGHSVGEVAAAWAAGALGLEEAVRLIHLRSLHQERIKGQGRMAVAATGAAEVQAFLDRHGLDRVAIAAVNGPASVTLSGPAEDIKTAQQRMRQERIPVILMDLDYPFHSALLDPLEAEMIEDLGELHARTGDLPFLSTVTGDVMDGTACDAAYWWRNIRQPVLFSAAVERAAELGASIFLEVSPRPILTGAISETLKALDRPGEAIAGLTDDDGRNWGDADPIWEITARLVTRGADVDQTAIFGTEAANTVDLPLYPWQRSRHALPQTSERLKFFGANFTLGQRRHPLIGSRVTEGANEWRQALDIKMLPYLADHVVDGTPLMAAACYLEMILAVGRDIHGAVPLAVRDLDIERPMSLPPEGMREISMRYTPENGVVEIWSRRRLSSDDWVRHAHGQVLAFTGTPGLPPEGPGPDRRPVSGPLEVYSATRAARLDYGPSFQRVIRLDRDADAQIVEMNAAETPLGAFAAEHVLDPTGFDASLHGLLLSRAATAEGEVRCDLPVRLRSVTVLKPHSPIRKAIVRRTVETSTSTTVDIALYAPDGEIVALLEGVYLRAVVLSRRSADQRVLRLDEVMSLAHAAPPVLDLAHAAPVLDAAASEAAAPDAWLLLQAFTLSLARRWLEREGTAPHGVAELTASPVAQRVAALVEQFEARDGRLELPEPEVILAAMVEGMPAAQAEIILASHALAHLDTACRTGEAAALTTSQKEQVKAELAIFTAGRERLAATLAAAVKASAPAPLPVLWAQPWDLGLWRMLVPYLRDDAILLSLATDKREAFDAFLAHHGRGLTLGHVDLTEPPAGAGRFDLLIGGDAGATRAAARRVKPGGLVAQLAPKPDPVAELLLSLAGLSDEIGAGERNAGERNAGERGAPFHIGLLRDQFRFEDALPEWSDSFTRLAVGRIAPKETEPVAPVSIIVHGAAGAAAQAILHELADLAEVSVAGDRLDDADIENATDLLHFIDTNLGAAQASETLKQRLLGLVASLGAVATRTERLRYWLALAVTAGDGTHPAGEPLATAHALRAFARVARNEFPMIDIRVVEFDAQVAPATVALDLAATLLQNSPETELRIAGTGVFVPRARRGARQRIQPVSDTARAVLRPKNALSTQDIAWSIEPRPAPAGDAVEIEVAYTGLNFRDVMVAFGILDEDLLSGGLTRAAFGFECSGTVTRIGPDCRAFAPGDRVMAFTSGAFASHVVAAPAHVQKVPDGLSLEEAATIPVAFATAWYALEEAGRLRAGDRVLIHGAVGAVGMAAIQIARRRGATVYATAGTPARRALACALGAEQAFDSRSLDFVDALLQIGGVDVVLNSLSGEAMREGVRVLRPFGRFLELGKRDYLNNTTLQLRPFVHNLSYFGIDLDELLKHDTASVGRIMGALGEHLADGSLRPLPYRRFRADDVADALHLMRSAEHLGKLIVRPARMGAVDPGVFRAAPDGVHLVVGGTAGFGLATAFWLADRGATQVAVASRRGVIDPAFADRVASYAARGVTFTPFPLDVTDASAVTALVGELKARFGTLNGVIHTALVLEDGMLSSLTPASLDTVLKPKVDGVLALDRATRGAPLDYFVVYSSATTLIGSPGQGAYVAANAFLEGVARRRRQEGLPAIAIGWGAISDTGVIARDAELAERLRRTTGVNGITSADGLAQLGRLLADQDKLGAVHFFADIGHSMVAEKLAILTSPTFAGLLGGESRDFEEGETDFASRLAGKSEAEAKQILGEAIGREIAKILRLAPEAVDAKRPLGEMGMDSLMALELRLALEQSCGIEMPIISISDRTVEDIVAQALPLLQGDGRDAAETPSEADAIAAAKLESFSLAPSETESTAAAIAQLDYSGERLT